MRKLLLLSTLGGVLFAQPTLPTRQVQTGGVLPATCNASPANVFVKTGSSAGVYYCSATNTWTLLGVSGDAGPPIGSAGGDLSGSFPNPTVTGINGVSLLKLGAGMFKQDAKGVWSIASPGTDYAPATSGTSILMGDGKGGFAGAAAGTDYINGVAALKTAGYPLIVGATPGSVDQTAILGSGVGGTGNGFFNVAGPGTSEKTYTFPNANATVVVGGEAISNVGRPVVVSAAGTAGESAAGSVLPVCTKYAVTSDNAAFLAAAATADVALFTLPQFGKILGITVKHSAQYSDNAGAMTDVSVSIGNGAAPYTQYTGPISIGEVTAVADTTFYDATGFKSTTMAVAGGAVTARFTAAGRDFGDGAATYLVGGSVDIYVCRLAIQ